MKMISEQEILIDAADIWRKELSLYDEGKNSFQFINELYDYLKPFYLLKKHAPFISKEIAERKPSLSKYYKSYLNRYKIRRDRIIEYFKHGEAFYDMNVSCVIDRSDVSIDLFARLFALKIRQFRDPSGNILLFLRSHFSGTFQTSFDDYKEFLELVKLHSDLFNENQMQALEGFIEAVSMKNGSFYKTVLLLPPAGQSGLPEYFQLLEEKEPSIEVESLVINNKDEIAMAETEIDVELPVDRTIAGQFTEDEIHHFFSFLYKNRDGEEGAFLSKADVERIFKNGITIPERPLNEKFKLNTSNRYPKQAVDYFIYAFISNHNRKRKKDFLRFLGNYIEDYKNALNPKGLESMYRNITGEQPKNFPFNLKEYLPARLEMTKPVPKRYGSK